MRRALIPAVLVAAVFIFVVPHFTHAAVSDFLGPIIPNQSDANGNLQTCAAGWAGLIVVLNNLIKFALSLGVLIAVLFIAWAGFLLVLTPTNPENRSKAKTMLLNAAIGLVLALASWLIVNTILGVLSGGQSSIGTFTTFLSGGDLCIKPTASSSSNSSAGVAITNPGEAGEIPSKICNAANAYRGTSTAAGPDGGNKACAWAVNNVLTNAGISKIGSVNVQEMENQLKGGRGSALSQSSAVCGDIVIEAGDSHVGICLNSGCSQVISNSSSRASFSWISGPDFKPSYTSGIGRFYRVIN